MVNKTGMFAEANRIFLYSGFAWVLLWLIPWGKSLSFDDNLFLIFIADMLKLGVALGIFILPGAWLYILLRHKQDPLFDGLLGVLPAGFALSVTIIAVIGILGRIFGFSFVLVKTMFMLIGLGELILLAVFKPKFLMHKGYFSESFRSILNNPPLLLALVLATTVTFNGRLFFIDDLSYLAYLTNWQHSAQLGFQNIVHEANVMENVRYWIAMYPMGQALLADLSGVPGILLLGNYLEIFLVPIAVIASYWFAQILGLSRRAAGISVLIQIFLYIWMVGEYWPVGFWFFINMAEDKVSAVFILAPVFFVFVLRFLQSPTKTSLFLVFLSGLSLTFAHPIILFYSCLIASGIVLFSWIQGNTGWHESLQLFMVFFASMLPYIVIRLSDIPSKMRMPFSSEAASATFQFERYLNVVSNVFYGLNPEVLKFTDISPEIPGYTVFQFFRLTPVILAACGGVLAFFNLRKGPYYWYIFICAILLLFAALPYTGWMLGYLVTARMVPRAAWFSPLGLSSVLILKTVRDWAKSHHVVDALGKLVPLKRPGAGVKINFEIVIYLVIALPVLIFSLMFQAPPYFTRLDYYRQLAHAGAYIDNSTSDQVTSIALDYWDTQFLPGVSARTVLISFREETESNGFNNFLSLDEIHARNYAGNAIRSLDGTISSEERCSFMEQYNLRFVLARRDNAELFKSSVEECEIVVENVFDTDNLVLLEITEFR
jgi:hypothetical protein